jgi:ceramide glucosyltransferase
MTVWAAVRDAITLLAAAPYVYSIIATGAAARLFRPSSGRQNPSAPFAPPLSILKPIRGRDREAYRNFASFCTQDYSEFEILFCVSDQDDPAVPIIEQVMTDFPQRAIRLLVGSEAIGASDKVNKLCRMAREARYDVLLVSDSDVRVDPGFLRAAVAPLADEKTGGVSCLYRGLTDGSVAADIEALGNSTDFAPGVLAAWALGGGRVDFMLGAVMVTKKQHLSEIGGFESIADYFCDDFELGNRLDARGWRVDLCAMPVSIVYPHQRIGEAFRHQLRWNLSIRYSRPWGHFGLLFAQALPWTIAAICLAPEARIAWAFAAGYIVLRSEIALFIGLRCMGDRLIRRRAWMIPVRDAFALIVWLVSFFPQRIHWRDREFVVRDRKLVPLS